MPQVQRNFAKFRQPVFIVPATPTPFRGSPLSCGSHATGMEATERNLPLAGIWFDLVAILPFRP
jgi:hypothetical protein